VEKKESIVESTFDKGNLLFFKLLYFRRTNFRYMSFKRSQPFIPFMFLFIMYFFSLHPSCAAQSADSTKVNLFDLIRPSYELMEFIAESEFVKDYKSASPRLVNDLKNNNIVLESSSDITPSPGEEISQFRSKDGSISISIIQHEDGEYLFNKWRTDHRATSPKSDIRNDGGGTVFLKTKTQTNSVVGAMFYTGRNLFEIVINLPFPVDLFDGLDAASKSIVIEKYKLVHKILESITRTYVAPDEFVLYPARNLSREQRLYGLIQFWTEVKYNFAFFDQVPDLNWDRVLSTYLPIIEKDQSTEEYYQNLNRMCALLKDGHTNIFEPSWINAAMASPPLQLMNIQNKAIVVNAAQSLIEKIPVGSEIVSVDDVPTIQYLRERIFPFISSSTEHIRFDDGVRNLLTGKQGTSVRIGFKTPDGKTTQVSLNRENNDVAWARAAKPLKVFEFKRLAYNAESRGGRPVKGGSRKKDQAAGTDERLPKNIAYVALNTFGNPKVVEEFENHIDSINSCERLIIDLRSNGGGSSTIGYRIIEHLTDKPFLTSKWRTREHRAAYKAWGSSLAGGYRDAARTQKEPLSDWDKIAIEYYYGNHWYGEAPDTIVPPKNKKINVPIVVLIGHKTASAAEDFLVALEDTKRAYTIGSKTFGSTGQPLQLKLPGGGSARICTKRDEYPDGKQFVGYGIKPELEVERGVEDVIEGKDSVLEKAVEVVKLRR
jgi:carboxyl-terminal processing protease